MKTKASGQCRAQAAPGPRRPAAGHRTMCGLGAATPLQQRCTQWTVPPSPKRSARSARCRRTAASPFRTGHESGRARWRTRSLTPAWRASTCASTATTRRSAAPAPVTRRAAPPLQRCGPIWLHARPDHRRQRALPSASPGAPRTEPRSATPPRLVGLDVNTTGGMPSGRGWPLSHPVQARMLLEWNTPCGCRRRLRTCPRRALYAWAQPYLHRHGSRDETSAITGWGDPQAARP